MGNPIDPRFPEILRFPSPFDDPPPPPRRKEGEGLDEEAVPVERYPQGREPATAHDERPWPSHDGEALEPDLPAEVADEEATSPAWPVGDESGGESLATGAEGQGDDFEESAWAEPYRDDDAYPASYPETYPASYPETSPLDSPSLEESGRVAEARSTVAEKEDAWEGPWETPRGPGEEEEGYSVSASAAAIEPEASLGDTLDGREASPDDELPYAAAEIVSAEEGGERPWSPYVDPEREPDRTLHLDPDDPASRGELFTTAKSAAYRERRQSLRRRLRLALFLALLALAASLLAYQVVMSPRDVSAPTMDTEEGTPEAVAVPVIDGASLPVALAALEQRGLESTIVRRKHSYPKDTVIRHAPDSDVVPEGTVITLFVSDGPDDNQVSTPNVIGFRLDRAYSAIRSVGLKPVSKLSPETTPAAVVVSQNPEVGTPVDPGATVTLRTDRG